MLQLTVKTDDPAVEAVLKTLESLGIRDWGLQKDVLETASLLNSPERRFFCEDVRWGVNDGRVVAVMSLGRTVRRDDLRERILNTAPQEPATGS